jgi:hypothetical protein
MHEPHHGAWRPPRPVARVDDSAAAAETTYKGGMRLSALPWLLVACGAPHEPRPTTSGPRTGSTPAAPVTLDGPLPVELARSGLQLHVDDLGRAPRAVRTRTSLPPRRTFQLRSTTRESLFGPDPLTFDTTFAIDLAAARGAEYPCAVDAGAGENARWFTEGLDCAVTLGTARAVVAVRMLDRDQQTGDADDGGDAMASSGRYYQDVRWAAQWLSVPWPSEPLGVGARWRVDALFQADGIVAHRSIRVEFVAVDRVTVRWNDRAPRQTVDPLAVPFHEVRGELPSAPNLPASITLVHVRAVHEGRGELDLVPGTSWVRAGSLTTTRTTSFDLPADDGGATEEKTDVTRSFTISS